MSAVASEASRPPGDLASVAGEAPATWQTHGDAGAWLVVRHPDVARVLRDGTAFGPAERPGEEADAAEARACRDRAAPFSAGCAATERLDALAVDALAPGIRARVVERLAAFAGCGAVDFVELIAPLATEVRATLAGVPAAHQDALIRSIDVLRGRLPGAGETPGEAYDALLACASELLAAKRARPTEDVLSDWIAATGAEAPSGAEDLAEFLQAFVGVTGAASRNVATAGLKLLFDTPWAAERLRAEPRQLPGAVEEMLRLAPPFHDTRRRALRDATLGGVKIAAGDEVRLWLRAANRDAAVFERPDCFEPGRPERSHLSFAAGGVFALTATLLRVELQILFEELLLRFPEILPAGPVELAPSGCESRILRLPVHLGTPS